MYIQKRDDNRENSQIIIINFGPMTTIIIITAEICKKAEVDT